MNPILDIVMLVHDQAEWADLAIRAVEHQTKNAHRLIIVDMASQEQKTKAMLADAEKRGHTVVRLAENRSFSNGVNAGIRVGSSKYVVVLNDDAMVTEGWDSALLQDATDKKVGLVGARSNYAAGAQGDPSVVGDPPYLVFVCVCMRREVFEKVGPMDEETFDGFSSEDLDYSWRVLKAGYRLKVSSAYVLHAGSRTLVKKLQQGSDAVATQVAMMKNNEKYNMRLIQKHGKEWFEEHSKLKPRIMVSSFHAEEHTRVRFLASLVNLKASGGLGFSYYQHMRSPIHVARQVVCDWATDQGYDVLVMLDDDATFPSDLLGRFYAHNKEVVTALAYQRMVPYGPCIYETDDSGMGTALEGYEHTGLRQVGASGFHCSMLRTSVIKKLRAAGIRQYFGGFENKMGEDFALSANLKKVGIPLYCDTELISGHIGSAIEVNEAFRSKWIAEGRPGLR
jgi:GT2 family glycosyltransferase